MGITAELYFKLCPISSQTANIHTIGKPPGSILELTEDIQYNPIEHETGPPAQVHVWPQAAIVELHRNRQRQSQSDAMPTLEGEL